MHHLHTLVLKGGQRPRNYGCNGIKDLLRLLSGGVQCPNIRELVMEGGLGWRNGSSGFHIVATEGLDLSHLTTIRVDLTLASVTVRDLIMSDVPYQQSIGRTTLSSSLTEEGEMPVRLPGGWEGVAFFLQHQIAGLTPQAMVSALKAWLAVVTAQLSVYPPRQLTHDETIRIADTLIEHCSMDDPGTLELLLNWLSRNKDVSNKVLMVVLFNTTYSAMANSLLHASESLVKRQHPLSGNQDLRQSSMTFLLRCLDLLDPTTVTPFLLPELTLQERCVEAGTSFKSIVKSLLHEHASLSHLISIKLFSALKSLSSSGEWPFAQQVEEVGEEMSLMLLNHHLPPQPFETLLVNHLADEVCRFPKRHRSDTATILRHILGRPSVSGGLVNAMLSPNRWDGLWANVAAAQQPCKRNSDDYFWTLLRRAKSHGYGFPPSTLLFPETLVAKVPHMDLTSVLLHDRPRGRDLCRWLIINACGSLDSYLKAVVAIDTRRVKLIEPRKISLSLEVIDRILVAWVALHDDGHCGDSRDY